MQPCIQMLADIRPNEEHAKEHIERNPVTTVVQVVPEMSEHEVRTLFNTLTHPWWLHTILHTADCFLSLLCLSGHKLKR